MTHGSCHVVSDTKFVTYDHKIGSERGGFADLGLPTTSSWRIVCDIQFVSYHDKIGSERGGIAALGCILPTTSS